MTRIASATLALLMALSAPALAAGGGSDSSGGDAAPTTKGCKSGQVWDKKTKKCVKAQSGVLPDEELYQQGRALAKLGRYDWAITVLATVQNQQDPRVLNYLGYANRKAGRLEIGITYYTKALAIDPHFNLAREYLGEGYVAAGRIDLAMAQLAAIAGSCGTGCDEYRQLNAAITAAQ